MSRTPISKVELIALASCLLIPPGQADPLTVEYPHGYRDWTHINSMILPAGHFEGLHHVYANDLALKALKDKTPYPDGAVFVFDLFEVQVTPENYTLAGPRRFVDVMVKDSRRFTATGGWGYEEFRSPTEPLLTDPKQNCHSCHAAKKDVDFVFSVYRD